MKQIILSILLILTLPIVAISQSGYTIPKKHRVIQEKTSKSQNVPIGTKFSDANFTTLNKEAYTLSTLAQQGPVVFVFLSVECPVAQRYAMRLKRMHDEYNGNQVTIVGVYSNENDSVEDVQAYLKRAEYPFPIVKDVDGSLARYLGASMTPQAHLIDTAKVLRYRGPIDDNRYETRVKHNYLKDALVSVLRGKEVKIKETPAFGCTIHLPDRTVDKQITYHEHIAPIIQKHCLSCHTQNGIASNPLTDYENTKAHAAKIAEYTKQRIMPPWIPEKGYGEFKNERRLTDTEIDMIEKWVDNDAQSGSTIKKTPIANLSDTWEFGEPDHIEVASQGFNTHPSLFIKSDSLNDVYIQGIDFKFKNSKTIRGITALFGSKLITKKIVKPDGTFLYSIVGTEPKINDETLLAVCTPGFAPTLLPKGVGYFLLKDTHLIVNLKYQENVDQEQNNLQVGFYFSKTPNTAKLRRATLRKQRIDRSENTEMMKDLSSYQFNEDVYVIASFPYAHSYKHEMRIVANPPGGERIKMLWIKGSDFNLQDIYYYKQPVFLSAGTRLEFETQKDLIDLNNKDSYPQVNEQKKDQICNFLYVIASEYTIN